MRLYIGGPMTGLPENNYPSFGYAFKRLVSAGMHPVSPHLLEANIEPDQKSGMSKGQLYKLVIPGDIFAIAQCDGMVLLPGWERSNGTAIEKHAADLFELPVFAPAYTSDEFPGGLDEWMDEVIRMVNEHRLANSDLGPMVERAEQIMKES